MTVDPFRVLVTGSRDFPLLSLVDVTLTQIALPHLTGGHGVVIVHGDCPHPRPRIGHSVDQLAKEWALGQASDQVRHEPHPADWDRYGKPAGFRRNIEMVALGADLCMAFIANGSRGSTHCADAAERARIPVIRIRVDGATNLLDRPPGSVDPQPEGGPHARNHQGHHHRDHGRA